VALRASMFYRCLADLTIAGHAAFVVFVAAGGLLVLRWPRIAWVHVPAVVWGVFIEYSGGVCPLTPIENFFRRRAGGAGYSDGFIEHYVVRLIYPAGLGRAEQIVLGTLALAVNTAVYWRVLRRAFKARGGP
jgi:Protein of Unknown function (DUF2784)